MMRSLSLLLLFALTELFACACDFSQVRIEQYQRDNYEKNDE